MLLPTAIAATPLLMRTSSNAQEVEAEQSSAAFHVTVATILINGFVAACINLPVQKGIAFLMLRLGAEREPVRRLTDPEKLLQQAAQTAWAQETPCVRARPGFGVGRVLTRTQSELQAL